MYKVSRHTHAEYGNVIEITRDELGEQKTPFEAFNRAKHLRRLWLEESKTKIRILVDDQVLTVAQADKWSSDEYKSLPKCEECGKILSGDVHTHQFCDNNLFCSKRCADQNYTYKIESLTDNDESEFECL